MPATQQVLKNWGSKGVPGAPHITISLRAGAEMSGSPSVTLSLCSSFKELLEGSSALPAQHSLSTYWIPSSMLGRTHRAWRRSEPPTAPSLELPDGRNDKDNQKSQEKCSPFSILGHMLQVPFLI